MQLKSVIGLCVSVGISVGWTVLVGSVVLYDANNGRVWNDEFDLYLVDCTDWISLVGYVYYLFVVELFVGEGFDNMTKKRFVWGGTDEEPTFKDLETGREYPSEEYSLLEFINELSEENESLKSELKIYRKVANCSNCNYHNYDWYDDGDEFEVCDKGNDLSDRICEDWRKL